MSEAISTVYIKRVYFLSVMVLDKCPLQAFFKCEIHFTYLNLLPFSLVSENVKSNQIIALLLTFVQEKPQF